jgi:hypothetical protein
VDYLKMPPQNPSYPKSFCVDQVFFINEGGPLWLKVNFAAPFHLIVPHGAACASGVENQPFFSSLLLEAFPITIAAFFAANVVKDSRTLWLGLL